MANLFTGRDERKPEDIRLYAHVATGYLAQKRPGFSASVLVTPRQKIVFIFLTLMICGAIAFWPMGTVALIGFSYVLLGGLIVGFRALVFVLGFYDREPHPSGELKKVMFLDPPVITVLIPLYKEHNMVDQIASAIEAFDYPKSHLDVKVLLEEGDTGTIAAARNRMRAGFYHFIIAPSGVGPQTKPRACNLGLWAAKGEYTVIYDAEDEPETDQLKKAVMEFTRRGGDVACLQARLHFYNARHNLLTRLFSLEYSLLFDFLLPGLARLGVPLPLGGTSNFFRTQILKEIGGWDPYNVTEDADVGMRLGALGYRSGVLHSTTYEQATSTFPAWTAQRSRWIKGFVQTWLVHSRHMPNPGGGGLTGYAASLHLVIGAVLWAVYLNPVFGLIFILLLFEEFSFLAVVFPGSIGDMAFVTFSCAIGLQILLMGVAPMKEKQWALMPAALLAPFYWGLQAIAGSVALVQIFHKPYYWEKTTHFARR